MIKRLIIFFLISITGLGSYGQSGYRFSIDTLLPHTPVKNQYRSSTCWCFSTISFIESEIIRTKNDTIDLSERYIVRNLYPRKITKYLSSDGTSTLSGGSLAHDVMNTIALVGIIPEKDSTNIWQLVKGGENTERIKSLLDSAIANEAYQKIYLDTVYQLLDAQYGAMGHDSIVDTGIEYCDQYLQLNPIDYVEITSFTHHPFYSKFSLEIPDNFSHDEYYNVPLDEFEQIVDSSIDKGYTISWDGDVSEKTFVARFGLAVLPDPENPPKKVAGFLTRPYPELEPTQELRQEGFDNKTTEDDHLMHIVGMAHDKNGTKYYIIKNSWGELGPYQGYIYMSRSYFLMKTIAIMVHKEVIPKGIKEKLKVKN